ncbi:Acyl-CoA dehydrogenase fadE12 [compost metagenome]
MYLPEQQYQTYFDNVVLRADALVGEAGKGLRILFSSLNSERLLFAVMNVNVGQADYVLKRAAEYAKVRAPFGVPIGSY